MSEPPPATAFEALAAVVHALERAGARYMLVGGLASFAWGDPRTTRDFDLAVDETEEDPGQVGSRLRGVLATAGVEPQGPFATAFGPRFVLPFPSIPIDVFLAGAEDAGRFARSRRVVLHGVALRVQGPEDFVVAKLRNAQRFPDAGRTDLQDAAAALFKQWRTLDLALARAEADRLGLGQALAALLDEVREARLREGLEA